MNGTKINLRVTKSATKDIPKISESDPQYKGCAAFYGQEVCQKILATGAGDFFFTTMSKAIAKKESKVESASNAGQFFNFDTDSKKAQRNGNFQNYIFSGDK